MPPIHIDDLVSDRRRFLAMAGALAFSPVIGCRDGRAEPLRIDRSRGDLYAGDFRVGGLDDRQVLQRAFAAWLPRGGKLHLEPGREYDLGAQRDATNVFAMSGLQDACLAGNGASFRIHNEIRESFNLFYLEHYRNLRIENLSCRDTGWQSKSGAKFIVLDANNRESVGLELDNVAAENLVTFINIQGRPGGPRVRDVRIMPTCRATRVYYGLACMNNGDDIRGGFTAINSRRAYFPYGVARHDLSVRIHHDGIGFGPAGETTVLIKSYGRPTSDLRVRTTFSGVLPWIDQPRGRPMAIGQCVGLEHQPDPREGPSIIENIDLDINIARGTLDPYGCHRLGLRSFLPDATVERRTRNIWRRIRLGGNLRPGSGKAIFGYSIPEVPSDIQLAPNLAGIYPASVDAPGFRFVIA